MNIDLQQLEVQVNLHAIQTDFKDLELHYVIAEDENTFRFAGRDELPNAKEKKFYCFLQEKRLLIPAGNVVLKESYVLTEKPIYPLISDCKDLMSIMSTVKTNKPAKAVRGFSAEQLELIKDDLKKEFTKVETHVVASPNLQHHIFVVDNIEISVSPTMVYLRAKAPFSESHYKSAIQENEI